MDNDRLLVSFQKRKPIFGVGINDADYVTHKKHNENLTRCKFYTTWAHMIERCYSEKLKEKYWSYRDCTMHDEWLVFSIFKKWMEAQDWQGMTLDKDILVRGNKHYSPETCLFVPSYVNKFLTNKKTNSSDLPAGVVRYGERFRAIVSKDDRLIHLGIFDTPESASMAYLMKKAQIAIDYSKRESGKVSDALVQYANSIFAELGEAALEVCDG